MKTTNYFKSVLLCCFSFFFSINVLANNPFAGGTGVDGDPYQIETVAQFDEIRNYRSAHFILNNDLDFENAVFPERAGGTNWWPVGEWGSGNDAPDRFSGVFDGGGYTLKNLTAVRAGSHDMSLFGVVDGGTIKNLLIENFEIQGNGRLGILTGETQDATIEQVGIINSKCINPSGNEAGGITGPLRNSTVRNSYVVGVEVSAPNNRVGGISAMVEGGGQIINCHASCTVSGGNEVGGIAGYISGDANAKVVNSVAIDCTITCTNSNFGRIVGAKHNGELTGNAANENILLNSAVASSDIGADLINGANASLTDLADVDFFAGLNFAILETGGDGYTQIWKINYDYSYPILAWQKTTSGPNSCEIINSGNYTVFATNNELQLEGLNGNEMISIYTVSGKLTERKYAKNASEVLSLPEKGIYIVSVTSGKEIHVCKIVN